MLVAQQYIICVKNIFLANSLRSFLMDEFTYLINQVLNGRVDQTDAEAICRLLTRLVNENLANFYWPSGLMHLASSQVSLPMLWKQLMKCNSLQRVSLKIEGCSWGALNELTLDSFIHKMHPYLQIVQIVLRQLSCNDAHLRALTQNMPNVRYITRFLLYIFGSHHFKY